MSKREIPMAQMFVVFTAEVCRGHEPNKWTDLKDFPLDRGQTGSRDRLRGYTTDESVVREWCKQYNQSIIDDGDAYGCCVHYAFYLRTEPFSLAENPIIPGYRCSGPLEEEGDDTEFSETEPVDTGFPGFAERHDLFMADHPDYEAQVEEDFRLIAEIRERQDMPEGDHTTED